MKRVNNNIYKILSIILIVVISIVNVPNALAAESIINDIVNITAKEETLYEKYQLSDLPSVVSSSVYSTEKTPVKIINQSVDDEYTITVKNDDGTNTVHIFQTPIKYVDDETIKLKKDTIVKSGKNISLFRNYAYESVDNEVMHQEIRKCLQPFFTEADMPQITDFFQGEELVEHYSSQKDFDIIFLDIEMGKMNGIDTATEVRKYAPETIIIFVSSHKNYVFDAFRCEAFHFLVKPIRQDEFDDVFNRALHKHRVMNEKYHVCWKNSRETLMIGDITYIEGYKRRLKVHIVGEEYDHIGKISDAYEELKAHGFILIHQGFLVNMHYIQSFRSDEAVLLNGEKLMISVRKRAEALQMYDKYIQKWKW